jgi:carbon-monoxide dehydrogenase large subunit
VNDALRHTGTELDDTPIHPQTVLAALDAAAAAREEADT